MYKPSAVATYHDLMQLVYAVSGDGDGPLSRDSANQVTSAFRALACKNPAAAEGKALELTWRYGMYSRINHFRAQATKSSSEEALLSMTNCCLGGILYFKQLLVQIRHCYPDHSFLNDLQLGMSTEADLKAVQAIAHLHTTASPQPKHIKSLVQMCLVKMGDLARYLSDIPMAREDAKMLQAKARNDAAGYYLTAQQLDASVGMIYNQLGAILEQKDSATNSVCLGACMHFAISATARNPAHSGQANFKRSIGIHRNALRLHVQDHGLELTGTLQHQKLKHAVHLLSLHLVPLFGSGVDQVDLDKCQELWNTAAPILRAILVHRYYDKSIRMRRMDEDIGMQAACFACICVWYAHEQIKICPDQVESMGYFTVFWSLAPVLISMGQVYIDCAMELLHQTTFQPSECVSQNSWASHVPALWRCLCALCLIFHVFTEDFDDQVYVQAQEATDALIRGCERLCTALKQQCSSGCCCVLTAETAFSVFSGSGAFQSLPAPAGKMVTGNVCIWVGFRGLADRLSGIDWHDPVRDIGVRFAHLLDSLSTGLSQKVTPGSEEAPCHVTDVDELDDIVLLPGQLGQRM